MIFRRLLAATCLFPAVAASTETLNLRRSIDPTLVVDETTVEAIAEYDALYKTLKEDFVAEGCVESWGEFPTATSTASMVDGWCQHRPHILCVHRCFGAVPDT